MAAGLIDSLLEALEHFDREDILAEYRARSMVCLLYTSMYPTLLDGERTFVEKVTYLVSPPARGDIVICRYPYYEENCVKRVIGLPGETVSIQNGQVYIDGCV